MLNFQKIVDVISDAFNILDFSHIISGTLTFLIITLSLHLHGIHLELVNGKLTFLCCLFLAYVCGIFSWALGRRIRRCFQKVDKDFEKIYDGAMSAISPSPNVPFVSQADKNLVYTYMWIKLSKNSELKERVAFIHRFWVMQAMFEGLITSWVIGFICLCEYQYSIGGIPCLFFLGGSIVIFVLFFVCMCAARENARAQIREVITSYYIYIIY